ncbi:MAG: HAD family phosphatase, partial [Oscillospiraceae bacterium]|nr:HAD family phosphatase [Oscillospiraceae bacterium]
MFKNYIFDFGQVLIKFDPDYMVSAFVTDEEDKKLLVPIIFDRLYWNGLDDGSITDTEVKEAVCKRLPKRLHKAACDIYDNWIRNLPAIDGMSELLNTLKEKGAKLYLLSNISCYFAENYESVPEIKDVLSKFDGVVFSAPIRMTKPDREIFEHLLTKFDLKAEDCIFIDDSDKNIQGAKSAGIDGYLFDGDSA